MAKREHVKILEQGAEVWNAWRDKNPYVQVNLNAVELGEVELKGVNLDSAQLIGAHLNEVDFSGASLHNANFLGAELRGTRFMEADLRKANLIEADMTGAYLFAALLNEATLLKTVFAGAFLENVDLKKANLSGVDFEFAELSNADLSGANLTEAYFRSTNLNEANFSNVVIGSSIFVDVDLSAVKGLDTVTHRRPSYLDVHTIYLSGGNIPEIFLRGIGLPDTFIYYTASLVGKAIEYYSTFISYSSKDQSFAERIYADLQSNGVRCWYAPENLKIGEKFRVGIDESIRIHDKLLLILSEQSVTSDWVEQEVETALEKERERGEAVLFPIRLDEAVLDIKTGWPALVKRTRHIGDFRQWKDHDTYQKSFERLLSDLKFENKQEH